MTETDSIVELFDKLFSSHRDVLSDAELKDIDKFVAAGEYGLALQTAADIYRESNKAISPETRSLLFGLADRMDIDRTELLKGTNKKL